MDDISNALRRALDRCSQTDDVTPLVAADAFEILGCIQDLHIARGKLLDEVRELRKDRDVLRKLVEDIDCSDRLEHSFDCGRQADYKCDCKRDALQQRINEALEAP